MKKHLLLTTFVDLILGNFKENRFVDGEITIRLYGESLKISGSFDEDERPTNVKFEFENSEISIEIRCVRGNIENVQFLKGTKNVASRDILQNGDRFSYKGFSPSQKGWEVDLKADCVYVGGLDFKNCKMGQGLLVDLRYMSFHLAEFLNDKPRGSQKYLSVGDAIPYVQRFETERNTVGEGKGRWTMRNAKGIRFEGRSTWKQGTITLASSPGVVIKGEVRENQVLGQCLLRFNEMLFKVEFIDGKMVVGNFEDMFSSLKTTSMKDAEKMVGADEAKKKRDEKQTPMLNGFNKVEYPDGSVYQGYLIDDHIYCHKDNLPSCFYKQEEDVIELGANATRKDSIIRFLSEVDKFKGNILNWKIDGVAQIRYNNGNVYKGRFNELWREQGPGLLIYTSGDLFKGNFQNGEIEGFGKRITSEKGSQSGYFSKGVLRVEISEEDELTHDQYDKLVKKVLVKDNFQRMFLNQNKLDQIQDFLANYKAEEDKERRRKMWEGENELALDVHQPGDKIMVSQVLTPNEKEKESPGNQFNFRFDEQVHHCDQK